MSKKGTQNKPPQAQPLDLTPKEPVKKVVLAVSSVSPRGFWRCGMRFTQEPRFFGENDLPKDQVQRLIEEPRLKTEFVER